ncbi:MAG: hypothetical protein NVSMB25_10010 [Thermoleophilaceae bacterium]
MAADVLAELRAGGHDPAHGGEAAARRGRKNAAHQRELAGWKPAPGMSYDAADFRREIAPALRERRIAELTAAAGLSPVYCSLIRLGKRVPHPRHWEGLARIEGSCTSINESPDPLSAPSACPRSFLAYP